MGLRMNGVEVEHEPFSGNLVQVVFEHFEVAPEGFHVVQWNLDGAVVEFVEDVRLFLFFPYRGCLWGEGR